jgi:hypothetical protein
MESIRIDINITEFINMEDKILFGFRIAAALTMNAVFIFILIDENYYAFVFLTNWGVFFTAQYFTIVCLSYYYISLQANCNKFFSLTWGLNWGITLMYWSYIYRLTNDNIILTSMYHALPCSLTLIDFSFNTMTIKRKDYVFVLAVLGVYTVLNVLVTTLAFTIYPGIDYRNWISYVVPLALVITVIAFLELGKAFKEKFCKRRLQGSGISEAEMRESLK